MKEGFVDVGFDGARWGMGEGAPVGGEDGGSD